MGKIQDCDAYCSLYVPDPLCQAARISITGDDLAVECPGFTADDINFWFDDVVEEVSKMVGVTSQHFHKLEVKHQKYAKILPIAAEERKRFMLWATEHYGIYSLGRFATWRPGLLLDDVVNDVRVIARMIDGSTYDQRKAAIGG